MAVLQIKLIAERVSETEKNYNRLIDLVSQHLETSRTYLPRL